MRASRGLHSGVPEVGAEDMPPRGVPRFGISCAPYPRHTYALRCAFNIGALIYI